MSTAFTARQGQFLAFIHGFTGRHGYAPSFEEIGAHFGVTPPSVNSMIKMLERKGCLSRLPGVARSLRVLVSAAALPGSDFGGRASLMPARHANVPASHDSADVAGAVAIAVLEALMPFVLADGKFEPRRCVAEAGQAVHAALLARGFAKKEAAEVARRVASEAARWEPTGKGTVIPSRQWVRRDRAKLRRLVTPSSEER